MKHFAILFTFILGVWTIPLHAQTPRLDSTYQRLSTIQLTDTNGIILTLMAPGLSGLSIANRGKFATKLMATANTRNSDVLRSAAYCLLGHNYRLSGNPLQALKLLQQGNYYADKTGHPIVIAMASTLLGNLYKDRVQTEDALKFYRRAFLAAQKTNNSDVTISVCASMGEVFLNAHQLDSSLFYAQKAEQIAITKHYLENNDQIYTLLGNTYSKLGNNTLAVANLHIGLQSGYARKDSRYFFYVLSALAAHYKLTGARDSAMYYGRRAVCLLQNDRMFNLVAKPAKLMSGLYRGVNSDSALKYADIAEAAGDSLNSIQASQQFQALTIEQELRQQEAAQAEVLAEQARARNIQYALLAVGIISILMLYFILSRSFITNIKVIEYAGVLALLIVFEFFNLLLHPMLESVTHHNPLLMLLALVTLAALLVPLHHRLEKWAISALVSKNKEVRLAAARRTINELT